MISRAPSRNEQMAMISEILGRGHIKHCSSQGCIHLTYGTVTLHFPNADAFFALATTWGDVISQVSIQWAAIYDPKERIVELEYRRTTVALFANEAVELGKMIAEASESLDFLRKYTAEEAWPEGDVYLSIPDLSQIPRSTTHVER